MFTVNKFLKLIFAYVLTTLPNTKDGSTLRDWNEIVIFVAKLPKNKF